LDVDSICNAADCQHDFSRSHWFQRVLQKQVAKDVLRRGSSQCRKIGRRHGLEGGT